TCLISDTIFAAKLLPSARFHFSTVPSASGALSLGFGSPAGFAGACCGSTTGLCADLLSSQGCWLVRERCITTAKPINPTRTRSQTRCRRTTRGKACRARAATRADTPAVCPAAQHTADRAVVTANSAGTGAEARLAEAASASNKTEAAAEAQ